MLLKMLTHGYHLLGLGKIIKENKDETWTIVSANDETQMGLDHGWHYETITFLRKQEHIMKQKKVISQKQS